MQLTPEEKLILSAAKIHQAADKLQQVNRLLAEVNDWDYLVQNAIDRGLGPLMYKKIQ